MGASAVCLFLCVLHAAHPCARSKRQMPQHFVCREPDSGPCFNLRSLARVEVDMSNKPYYAILTMVFATEGDIRIWRDKLATFSTPEAVSYLK